MLSVASAMAFSLYVLMWAKAGSRGLSMVSVAVDAVTCFGTLVPDILYPTDYGSILMMPDTASLVLITVASGFRHSARAAVLGGLLNGVSLMALTLLDRARHGVQYANSAASVTVYAIILLAAAAMAVVIARRTRVLAERGATDALTAERARRGVATLLSEHHDVRSLVSAAAIDLQLLEAEVQDGDSSVVGNLREDLGQISERVARMLDRAALELDSPCSPVRVALIARASVERVARRFPHVNIEPRGSDGELQALVSGGATAFQRALTNLLINACEGDGDRGATKVELSWEAVGGEVRVEVRDDGPGFRPSQLAALPGQGGSTKAGGTGFGLGIAARLAERSDGQFLVENGAQGGARVTLILPLGG